MILEGFADPVLDAQAAFRALMNAMARPGSIEAIGGLDEPPAPLGPAMAALALTLLDHETPVHLDLDLAGRADLTRFLAFHTGAPLAATPADAAFALVGDGRALPPLATFALGTDAYPDRSTTLIVAVEALGAGARFVLSGPGIDGETALAVDGLPDDLTERLAANRALFPRGVDLVLTCGREIAALPRSTRVIGA